MSDRAACKITIAGKLLRDHVAELAATAESDDAGENYVGNMPADQLEDMIEGAAATGQCLEWTNGEKTGASFELIEAHCRELGLAYVRHSDPYPGSWPESVEFWQPGMAEPCEIAAYDGIPCLNRVEIRAAWDAGTLGSALNILERIEWFGRLNKLEIVEPEAEPAPAEPARADPRDARPDAEMEGRDPVFRGHNCAGCDSGLRPCRFGHQHRRQCDWLHARND